MPRCLLTHVGRAGGHHLFQSTLTRAGNTAPHSLCLSRNDSIHLWHPKFSTALAVPNVRAAKPVTALVALFTFVRVRINVRVTVKSEGAGK
jgi:hypothetical protein